MIRIHRWTCIECEKKGVLPFKWFLKTEDGNEIDIQRLDSYEAAVSMHVFQTKHTVKYSQKGDTVFKYV